MTMSVLFQETKEPKTAEEKAEETIANMSYTLQSIDSSLRITLKEPIPRDTATLQKLDQQHKVYMWEIYELSTLDTQIFCPLNCNFTVFFISCNELCCSMDSEFIVFDV